MAQGIRFLVVDDNSKLRKFVVDRLREMGVTTVPCEAEDTGRSQAMLAREPIDFLIVGWNLPAVGGPGFVRLIRGNLDWRRLHVLLLATEAKRDNALVAAEAGANDHILWPFSADALEKKIGRIATLARMLSQAGEREPLPSGFLNQNGLAMPLASQPIC